MLLSNQPTKVQVPFANSGTKNTIPVASQIGITAGAASFTDGFPPLTFTPIASGGVPPSGADFNGILNAVTSILRWQSGGGHFTYDSAWATANSGYAKGSLLLKADGSGFWFNTSDGNTVNPDTVGTNWLSLDAASLSGALAVSAFTGSNQSLVSNGYQKLPGGLIIQWCSGAATTAEGSQTITFPITFPNACLGAFPSALAAAASGSYDTWYQLISKAANNCVIYAQQPSANGNSCTPLILAVGY